MNRVNRHKRVTTLFSAIAGAFILGGLWLWRLHHIAFTALFGEFYAYAEYIVYVLFPFSIALAAVVGGVIGASLVARPRNLKALAAGTFVFVGLLFPPLIYSLLNYESLFSGYLFLVVWASPLLTLLPALLVYKRI